VTWEPLPVRAVGGRTADERRASVANVLAWAAAGGARLQGVAARVEAAGNVAMYATRELAPGELILALPRRLMIIDSDVAPGESSSHAALAAWLAAHDPASPWRVYLDDLPAQVPGLPLFHDATDFAALSGTTAQTYAVADRIDLLAAHARTQLPLADFAWGWAVVRSRAFHAPGSFGPHLALMPILDLFDHGHGDTTWTYDPSAALFSLTAERAIGEGEPVTNTYGDMGNGRLLAHYGFTLPEDPFAEAVLVFERTAVAVACRLDHRFEQALSVAQELAGSESEEEVLAVLADAARRGISMLASPPTAGDREWDLNAARVRSGERAVLEQYAALADHDGPLYRAYRSALDEQAD
jgi:hypothetical protein